MKRFSSKIVFLILSLLIKYAYISTSSLEYMRQLFDTWIIVGWGTLTNPNSLNSATYCTVATSL